MKKNILKFNLLFLMLIVLSSLAFAVVITDEHGETMDGDNSGSADWNGVIIIPTKDIYLRNVTVFSARPTYVALFDNATKTEIANGIIDAKYNATFNDTLLSSGVAYTLLVNCKDAGCGNWFTYSGGSFTWNGDGYSAYTGTNLDIIQRVQKTVGDAWSYDYYAIYEILQIHTEELPVDSTAPFFSNNQTNATAIAPIYNRAIQLNLTIGDDEELHNVTFSHNLSGAYVNITTIDMTGVTTFTYIWNLTVSSFVKNFGWKVQGADAVNNINVSQIYEVDVKTPPLALRLFDILGTPFSFSNINTSTDFIIRSNYSYDNKPIIDANCNFTAYNISAHFSLDSDTNISLVNANDQQTLIVDEGFTDMTNDFIEFRVCRLNVLTGVDLLVNGTIHKTIPSNVIPLCSNGFHTETNITQAYNTKRNLNITVRCSDCNGGQRQITMVKNMESEIIQFNRGFGTHKETMAYNSTLELYEYNRHEYVYKSIGVRAGNISLACDTTLNNTFAFDVQGFAPVLSVTSINDLPFVEGMSIESNLTTVISIEAIGNLAELKFNVTFSNGTLIKEVVIESMTLTEADLSEDGFYNISISAVDINGLASNISTFFLINDTIPPVILSISPASNSTTAENTGTFSLNATFTDINLFRYWVNVTQKGSSTLLFNESVQISGNSYDFNNLLDTSNYSNATHVVNYKVCDGHTDTLIKDATGIVKSKEKITFQFGDTLVYLTSINGEEMETKTEKLEDRYTFEFLYNKKTVNKVIELRSNKEIIYLPDSEYKGHFIIDNTYWVDFEQVLSVVVERGENGSYLIYIDNSDDKIKFSSIGFINCEFLAVEFGLTTIDTTIDTVYNINLLPKNFFNTAILDTSTTAGVLLFFFLFLILISLIVFSEHIQMGALGLFVSIYFFFFGMLIYTSISAILGLILVMMGLFYLFRSIGFAIER